MHPDLHCKYLRWGLCFAGITHAALYDKVDKSKPDAASVVVSDAIGGQPTERGASPVLYTAVSPELEGKGLIPAAPLAAMKLWGPLACLGTNF